MQEDLIYLDALSELTRKERQYLLVASGFGFVVAKTGFVPTKIEALGIEITEANRDVLLKCLAGIVAYFLISFLIYASDDFVAYRQAGYKRFLDKLMTADDIGQSKIRVAQKIKSRRGYRVLDFAHRRLRLIRNAWDFLFPVIAAGYVCYVLWLG